MSDLIDQQLRASLARFQVALGECLRRDQETGKLTLDQYEWILDFLSRMEEMEPDEVTVQWQAFEAWRDQTHPERHKGGSKP